MRVLLVSHNYPPEHRAGTEIHTHQLAVSLARRGHDVSVFTTEKEISRPHLSVRDRELDGIAVREVVNNLYFDSFRETWENAGIERVFAAALDELKPDVVHFQHLLYLSVGCVEEAARRGLPVVFTLHDYWLQCPRYGQLVHADGSICHTVDFRRCATCLTWFKFRQTSLERTVGRGLAALRAATGLDLGPLARRTAHRLLGEHRPPPPPGGPGASPADCAGAPAEADPPQPAPEPAPTEADLSGLPDEALVMGRAASQRAYELRARLGSAVTRFLCPSRFLLERFEAWGLPQEKLRYLPHGIDLAQSVPRVPRGEHLRVAFIGSLVPAKGPHVLLEAWGLVPEVLRRRGRLEVHGPVLYNLDYIEDLRAIAGRVGATVGGALTREEVPRVLARTDLLVVPSLWFENAPLIILEAKALRAPLAVSDLGGMAELVVAGEHGFLFPVGDRHALRRLFERLLARPEELDELYRAAPELPTHEGNVAAVVATYEEALAGR